jgi:hypothetical protein
VNDLISARLEPGTSNILSGDGAEGCSSGVVF